jgi:hypothetical protein
VTPVIFAKLQRHGKAGLLAGMLKRQSADAEAVRYSVANFLGHCSSDRTANTHSMASLKSIMLSPLPRSQHESLTSPRRLQTSQCHANANQQG